MEKTISAAQTLSEVYVVANKPKKKLSSLLKSLKSVNLLGKFVTHGKTSQ